MSDGFVLKASNLQDKVVLSITDVLSSQKPAETKDTLQKTCRLQ